MEAEAVCWLFIASPLLADDDVFHKLIAFTIALIQICKWPSDITNGAIIFCRGVAELTGLLQSLQQIQHLLLILFTLGSFVHQPVLRHEGSFYVAVHFVLSH